MSIRKQIIGRTLSIHGNFVRSRYVESITIKRSTTEGRYESYLICSKLETLTNHKKMAEQSEKGTPLALPAPGDASTESQQPATQTLNVVEGTTIQMDALGPIIGKCTY